MHHIDSAEGRCVYTYESGRVVKSELFSARPSDVQTYEYPECAPIPLDRLPFGPLPAGCTLVTLSSEAGLLLARCRPLSGAGPEAFPSEEDFPHRSLSRSDEPFATSRPVSAAWPEAVVVRFFKNDNLLEIRQVRIGEE